MNNKITLGYNEKTGSYTVNHNGFEWISDGRRPYLIIRKKVGKKYISTYKSLFGALEKTVDKSETCIKTTFAGFSAFGKVLPFSVFCKAEVTGDNTVEFSIRAENETGLDISSVYFPAPFNNKTKCKKAYAVDCMRQGFLMPDGFRENFASTFGFANYIRKIGSGDCYLPLWGRVADNHSFSAIIETPYDACMFSSFGKRGSFLNSVLWQSSLGKLAYERKIRFIFHTNCDYNQAAKDYRNYLIEKGELLTLKEKITKNENIKKIIGAPVLHHQIFANIRPASKFYDKNGTNKRLFATFFERARQLEAIKAAGLDRLYIHTDGWGKDGYDNNHPYILPPCEEAGGYEGLKELSLTAKKLGYVFALHDQYRDYYYTCPKFDKEKAFTKIDGTRRYCSIWDGGKHTFLCASQAPDFVKETYRELEEHGVDVAGAYLDVFSIVPGDECFSKNHKITREESVKYRAACFDLLNDKGFVMSSEEPAFHLVNKLALVHHGPYTLRPQENGKAVGIPVPITSLVFHDCVIIPWGVANNWGVPKTDKPDMHCILNAGMPYFNPFGRELIKIGSSPRTADTVLLSEKELKSEIARVKKLCAIQAALYDKEMIKHEFKDGLRVQRTTYSDGTKITVDLDKNTYTVEKDGKIISEG